MDSELPIIVAIAENSPIKTKIASNASGITTALTSQLLNDNVTSTVN